jgi:hypothetical protein
VNLLFFGDVLFRTTKITKWYPTQFGFWNKMEDPWNVQLLFPNIHSRGPGMNGIHGRPAMTMIHPRNTKITAGSMPGKEKKYIQNWGRSI